MNIISFNDIIEVNGILKDKSLNFRIHLRDACGGQSLCGLNQWETVHAKGIMKNFIRNWRIFLIKKGLY